MENSDLVIGVSMVQGRKRLGNIMKNYLLTFLQTVSGRKSLLGFKED